MSDVLFNVVCEMSQRMVKTELFSRGKTRTNAVSQVRDLLYLHSLRSFIATSVICGTTIAINVSLTVPCHIRRENIFSEKGNILQTAISFYHFDFNITH